MNVAENAVDTQRDLDGLLEENARLKARLWEAEEVLKAIREGEVDAVVVGAEEPDAVYTFFGADHPYRLLVEGMQEGAVTLSPDGIILYANESFAKIVGRPLGEIFGATFASFVDTPHSTLYQAFLQQEGEDKAELELCRADGQSTPVYLSRSAVDLVGTLGIALVVTDLAEQKRHESIVSEGRLSRLILEQATEAIVVCDPNGRITQANRKAASLARANPLLKPFTDAFNIEPTEEDAIASGNGDPASIRLISQGRQTAQRLEVTISGNDGEPNFLLLSGGPLLAENGQVLGSVIVMADITPARRAANSLKRSEARLRVLNTSLEERVASRTRELEEANQLLAHKNRELQEFAYVASHDLQEPLRKVQTFAGLLKADYGNELDDDAHLYLSRMEGATHRMSKLITDLLALSRVATHGKPFEAVDLNEVFAVVRDDMDVLIREHNATVEAGDLPVIEGDATQMRQLFQNLIANGIIFQKQDAEPVVRVETEPSTAGSSLCQIRFADNGIGFETRFLDRIFAPFQRLHGRSKYPGTGMGLAICQRIVERHRGSITAESTPGEGSVFTVTLSRCAS
jgi:PAS domain S-box-containing protein